MADMDDLADILDSALDDFRVADPEKPSHSRESEETSVPSNSHKLTVGQGFGIELPALGSRGRRGTSSRTKPSRKIQLNSMADEKSAGSGRIADTLQELAHQTRQTLEAIDINDQEATADKLVESIVKQFEEMGNSEDMQSIMDTIMHQLLSKEVLHEPMKEFCLKYPNWLAVNKSSLSEEDFERYSNQYQHMKELCGIYESTPEDFLKIVDIMQNMQACGQPPDDLIQELGPGLDLKGDGLPFLSGLFKEGDESVRAHQSCSMM